MKEKFVIAYYGDITIKEYSHHDSGLDFKNVIIHQTEPLEKYPLTELIERFAPKEYKYAKIERRFYPEEE